jgi:hypothetical protein
VRDFVLMAVAPLRACEDRLLYLDGLVDRDQLAIEHLTGHS